MTLTAGTTNGQRDALRKGKASRKKGHTMNYKQLHDVLAGVALILTLVTTFVVCGFLEAVL